MSGTRPLPPISSHPAFPGAVALWFAALFGLGTFVMPVGIFENLVTGTGLSGLISAAEPPLGTTAKLLISLIAALFGAGIGMLVAKRIGIAQSVKEASKQAEQEEFPPLFKETEEKPADAPEQVEAVSDDVEISEASPDAAKQEEPARPRSSWRARLVEGGAAKAAEEEEVSAADRLVASLPKIDRDDAPAEEESASEPVEAEHEVTTREETVEQAEPAAIDATEIGEIETVEELSEPVRMEAADDILVDEVEQIVEETPREDTIQAEPDEAVAEAANDILDAQVIDTFENEPESEIEPEPATAIAVAPEPTDIPELVSDEEQIPGEDETPDPEISSDEDPVHETGADEGSDASDGAVSLMNLVARLERAIAEFEPKDPIAVVDSSLLDDPLASAAEDGEESEDLGSAMPIASKDDPVIAFLRREVDRERTTSEDSTETAGESDDAQANLRKALDRLTQVNSKS